MFNKSTNLHYKRNILTWWLGISRLSVTHLLVRGRDTGAMRDQTTWALKWIPNNNRDKFEQTEPIGCLLRRGGKKKHFSSFLLSLDWNASNCWLSFTHTHCRSGMWNTCCTCVTKRPGQACLHWATVKVGGRIRVAGCVWMDSSSCDVSLRTNLPPLPVSGPLPWRRDASACLGRQRGCCALIHGCT